MRQSPRTAANNDSPIARRRISYALAAGAVAAGAATEVRAAIVYSGLENLAIEHGKSQLLRLDEDNRDDMRLENFVFTPGGVATNYQGVFLPFSPARLVGKFVNNLSYASALDAGFEVNASNVTEFDASLAYGNRNPNAEFNQADSKYIGFRFPKFPDPFDPSIRENHYAWVRVSINNAAGTFVIHDWAYESEVDVPIVTGDRGAAGDFNEDGHVDAADYTIWRDALGSDHILAGHGDENGGSRNVVDNDDYTLWKANFGYGGGGAVTTTAAPEPGSLGLLAAGALGVTLLRRRRLG